MLAVLRHVLRPGRRSREPETRNVKHLLDTRRIDCFADVHSYSELVLYPWGHAPTQTADPSKRFTTLPTGTCQPLADPDYQEFMLPARPAAVRDRRPADRRPRSPTCAGAATPPNPASRLYPTTGTHSDYAYSRHIADPSLHKTYGYTLETGPSPGNARDVVPPGRPGADQAGGRVGSARADPAVRSVPSN